MSQSNVPVAAAAQPNIQPSNDPMDVRARLDALYTSSSSSKDKKDLDLVKTWLEDLNQAFPGHTTDVAPCVLFYTVLEGYITKVQNRSNRQIGVWKRRGTVNLSKVKNEYLLLRPKSAQSQLAVSSRAITLVDHTARTLAVIGEAVPGGAPLKGVGAALERIAELAKTAKGNRDEAIRLGKHAESIKQLLVDNLGSAPTVDKEIERDLRGFEVTLSTILRDLERFQKPKGKRLQAFVFAKDRKDELRGLQQRLDDAFKTFLTANMMALRLGMARLEARTSLVCQTPDDTKKGEEKIINGGSAWITALNTVLHQFVSGDRSTNFFFDLVRHYTWETH